MKSLRNLTNRPAAAPLAADDILEFHAGRLLLLLSTCGGSTGTINGLTKMAKLDFFVRYPDFFSAAVAEGLRRKATRTDAVEAAMVRHHYGPWDKRYYHILAYLESRQLINVNAGEKLHRRAGAKLHHDGIGASLIGLCGTEGGCARSRERSSPATA